MSDESVVRPAERLALILSTVCLVAALPLLSCFWVPYAMAIVVIVLAARPGARKAFAQFESATDWSGVFRVLRLLFLVVMPLSVPPTFLIVGHVTGDPDLSARLLSPWLMILACVGAWLPLLIASLAVASPSERRFSLLRTLGLLQVVIACVIATAPWVRYLTLIYLAVLILALRPYQPDPDRFLVIGGPPPTPAARPWSLWRLLALAAAFVGALLTPPYLGNPGGRLGESNPRFYGINLNQTGPVRLPRAVAFKVSAHHLDGTPRNDLPINQRFRHQVLEFYASGTWTFVCNPEDAHREAGEEIADLGPDAYLLDFRCRKGVMVPVVAEPVRMAVGEPRSPISRPTSKSDVPLFLDARGTLRANPYSPLRSSRYRQVMPASADRQRTPAEKLTPADLLFLQALPAPEFVDFAEDLLTRLTQERAHGLEESDLERLFEATLTSQTAVPINAERVARAVARYLAESGDYSYSLDQPRQDWKLDATFDFLVNVKAGHCERFASALALILRAWQIPCRVVVGYAGVERTGDGTYVVRQNRAHAWVEALVARPGEEDHLDWLTLDATPATVGDGEVPPSSSWWGDFVGGWGDWWDDRFDGVRDPREWLWDLDSPTWMLWLLIPLGALFVLPLTVRAFLRRRRKKPLPPLYARLLALLARHGHPPPQKGQTPQEYAQKAAADLGSDVPVRVVAWYYRERYGGAPPTAEEALELDGALDELERSLGNGQAAWFGRG